jgi:hypothetical protein
MTDEYKIYVDAGRPATLNDGAGALTDCATLQEAVLAWQRLAPVQKIRATVKVIGGPVYIWRTRLSGSITDRSRRDAPAAYRPHGFDGNVGDHDHLP